jgi:hypothetical protein
MSMVITIKNVANGSTVRMEVEYTDRVGEVIESAAEYWKKDAGAYVLRKGRSLLSSSMNMRDAGVVTDDILEMIPDPEGGA